jgi:hypothetical protein
MVDGWMRLLDVCLEGGHRRAGSGILVEGRADGWTEQFTWG